MAKEFLSSHRVEFENIDLSVERHRVKEMVDRTGTMSTPVIIVEDEIVRGFDKEKLIQLLHLN
jgi:glutaredoxin 3